MARHLFLLSLGTFLVWWGCSSPSEVENPGQVLIVQAYLVPGRDARVKLRRTLPPERYYDGLEDTVSRAEVEIETGGRVFALAEDPDERGTYVVSSDLMPVVSGRTYHLRAEYEGERVLASTTVPFPPEITEVTADTIVYFQRFADLYGDLVHPGEFHWKPSENAAGYVVVIEAVEVRSLGDWALPLTGDLDSLIDLRTRLEGEVGRDSLEVLDRRIEGLRRFFSKNISLVRSPGDTIRWLRDREQEEWDEIDGKDWSEGKKWREKMERLFSGRVIDFWVPADTLRSDYWWLGVRFEGEYEIRLQAADRNYFDYYTTYMNGQSGSDGDRGPLFHVQGGVGLFGSYAEDRFRVIAVRGDEPGSMKIRAVR